MTGPGRVFFCGWTPCTEKQPHISSISISIYILPFYSLPHVYNLFNVQNCVSWRVLGPIVTLLLSTSQTTYLDLGLMFQGLTTVSIIDLYPVTIGSGSTQWSRYVRNSIEIFDISSDWYHWRLFSFWPHSSKQGPLVVTVRFSCRVKSHINPETSGEAPDQIQCDHIMNSLYNWGDGTWILTSVTWEC